MEWSVTLAMADARVDACLAVLLDAAHQISEVNHRVTGRWSAEEERLFVIGVGRYGKRWSVIASHVGTRTGVQVRTHAVGTQWPAGGGRWCGEEGACPHSSPTRSWVLLVGRALTCGSTPSRSVSPSSSVSLSPSFPLSHSLLPPLSPTLAAALAAKDQQEGGQANEHGDGINRGTRDPTEASMLWTVPSPWRGCPCRGPPGHVPAFDVRVQAVRETRGYYLEAEGGYTYYLAAEGSSRWEQWLARRELLAALPRRWRPGML